jgi:hypothetical protein
MTQSSEPDVALPFRGIYEAGVQLRKDIDDHLSSWPRTETRWLRDDDLPADFLSAIEDLRDRAYRWFNLVTANVLPHTTHHREYITGLLRKVSAAVAGRKFYVEYRPSQPNSRAAAFMFINPQPRFNEELDSSVDAARGEAAEAMNEALRVVRTAQAETSTPSRAASQASHVPNSAFIIMWMDPAQAHLEDVHLIVKETFAEFGIAATRADDIEHQGRITDVVLEHIARAEFLFADLSGARPNVYYEIGYAHALGKRPILYRQEGTPLHFDLSVHNVPEYKNITDLRQKLRDRLAAVTGRGPQARGAG